MTQVPTRAGFPGTLRRGLALAAMLMSCESTLLVGDLECPPSEGGALATEVSGVFKACGPTSSSPGGAGDGGASNGGAGGETAGAVGGGGTEVCPAGGAPDGPYEGPLPAPWQTSFDAGFCSYEDEAGFCYKDPDSSYRLVSSPVHSGTFAAAFDMSPSTSDRQRQTRCVRQGVMPLEAYYGAWYYIPSSLVGANDWNLFHFQGGPRGTPLHGLWDVSMDDSAGNGLEAFIYDAIHDGHYGQTAPKPIPRDRWVHLEFYWKRATDATGEVALFQDGEEVVRRSGIVTDDSPFGEWYVGNYTATLSDTVATVTLYVDDVTVRLP